MSTRPTKIKTPTLHPFRQKKKNIAVASSLNTKASARINPLPPQIKPLAARQASSLQNKKKDVKTQQKQPSQTTGVFSRRPATLRALRKVAAVRARRQWIRFRRGRLACARYRRRAYYQGSRVAILPRMTWALRVSRLYPARRRMLRHARVAVLLRHRLRRALFPRAVWRSLRRKYDSRARRALYRSVRTSPIPLVRRMIAPRAQIVRPYLRRRRRRFVYFKRAASRVAPERRVRSYVHRLVRRLTVAVVQRLRGAMSKQLSACRSRDLRGAAYTLRKNPGSLQYSRLYSRHIAAMLGHTRLATIRFLRYRRQFIPRKGRLYSRAPGAKGRGHRRPSYPRRRRWFLRRACLASHSLQYRRRSRHKQLPQPRYRVKLRYPQAVRRILRLQKVNLRIKRSFSFQHSPTNTRPYLRFVCRRSHYKQKSMGAAAQRLLRRAVNTPLLPVVVKRRLQLQHNQMLLRTFVRRTGELARKQLLSRRQIRRWALNFLSVSRGLHRRYYFTPPVLTCPVSVYTTKYRQRNFIWRPRSVWYFSRYRLRARRLRFLRVGGVSAFSANNSMYYYPQLRNDEKLSSAGGALLQTQAAAVYLYQLATAHGIRLARIARRTCVSSSSIPLPLVKFARIRGRLRLYARARFALRGLHRRPRFNRRRRITRIYQRRRSRVKRKLFRAVRCMSSYQRGIYCFKQRIAPTQVLKTTRMGRLDAVRSGLMLRHWKHLRRTVLRSRIRTRRLRRRLRALYRRSRRRRKPFRRWRNKRYRGRWRNFRRPAWLNKQYAPRRLKLRKGFVLLPPQKALTARLSWLLRCPSPSTEVERWSVSPTVPTTFAAASKSGTARVIQKLPFAPAPTEHSLKSGVTCPPDPAATAEAAATRKLWAKIFATKGNQPAAPLSTSASPHKLKVQQQPSIVVQDKKKR